MEGLRFILLIDSFNVFHGLWQELPSLHQEKPGASGYKGVQHIVNPLN